MVDLGANFGEISLCFAKNFPNAKIIAVEPSTLNHIVMKKNIRNQEFDTKNIIIEKVAITDKIGTVKLSTRFRSENSIILDDRNHLYTDHIDTEEVVSNTLSNIIEKHNLKVIDFLKIDIEGAEPLLINCLKKHGKNIKSILIEMGRKNTYEEYEPLFDVFFESGFTAYIRSAENEKYVTIEEAKQYLFNLKNKAYAGADYWFVREKE